MIIRLNNPSGDRKTCGWRGLAAIALFVVCILGAGCGPEPPPRDAAIERFIDLPPQELFEASMIATSSPIFDLEPVEDDGGWQVGGDAIEKGEKSGRLLVHVSGGGVASFTRNLEEAPRDVDVIEIEIGGLKPSNSVRLYWADKDQDFEKRRSIRFGARLGKGSRFRVFRFPVGAEPTWSSSVRRLRLEVAAEGQNIHLGPVVGLGFEVDPERLDTALARGWLCELGGTHRGARLGHPGRPIERRLRVPAGAELRFGVGLGESQPTPVDLRVKVKPADPMADAAVVFERRIEAGTAGAWSDEVVDLAAFAGQEVTVTLEVEAAELDPVLGLPMWAGPVVWAPTGEASPPNIVLISIDTLRADHMSLYGYPRATTPRLDAWAKGRAAVFETVVAPSPWTLPSHVSMLTGMHALGHGVNHAAPAPATILTLAEILYSKGYATGAATGGSYLHPRFGLAQGFESYRSFKGDLKDEIGMEVEAALEWIDDHETRSPFFLFFHTYEVHDPYDPREPFYSEYAGRPLDSEYRDAVTRNSSEVRPDRLRNTNRFVLRSAEGATETEIGWDETGVVTDLYDSGIAFADQQIARILDRLDESGLGENTIVVLTSDHGEALGEHRLAGHSSLYDHDLLVPLVISLPGGVGRGERIAPQVRSVDLVPTVLDAAGVEPPPGIDGRSLIPLITGKDNSARPAESYAALSNHGLALRTVDDTKYIYRNLPWNIPRGWEELYDLDADPDEKHNLAKTSPVAAELRSTARLSLEERQSGLRLVLSNRGEAPAVIEFEASGMVVGPNSVKALDFGGGCRIAGMGAVACELAPGLELPLVIERIELETVELNGSITPGASEEKLPFSLTYEIGRDSGPMTAVLAGGRVVVKEGGAPPDAVSVTISWTGDPGILGISPAETDDELRQQLQALGYIE